MKTLEKKSIVAGFLFTVRSNSPRLNFANYWTAVSAHNWIQNHAIPFSPISPKRTTPAIS